MYNLFLSLVMTILYQCQSQGCYEKKYIFLKQFNQCPQEIIERCSFAMINEGFKILEEGIAEKPEDIDGSGCLNACAASKLFDDVGPWDWAWH